jgi:hypothetical protein
LLFLHIHSNHDHHGPINFKPVGYRLKTTFQGLNGSLIHSNHDHHGPINFKPVGYRLKTAFQQVLIHASTFNQLDTG